VTQLDLQILSRKSLAQVDPAVLLSHLPRIWRYPDAALFLGKAAWRAAQAIKPAGPCLGIGPLGTACAPSFDWIEGEHPLPGHESFRAGERLLEFFDELRRRDVRHLNVFLSGGASSMLWLRPANLSPVELERRLSALYRQALSIEQLNQHRAQLCALKSGGAAAWLARLSPRTKARVFVLSDVAPYPPKVVASGPFYDGRTPHVVLADNSTWVKAATTVAQAHGFSIITCRSAWIAPWQEQLNWTRSAITPALRLNRSGIIVLGGEALLQLPARAHAGAGGRLTHLACALTECFLHELRAGQLELLFSSSDGQDGRSRSSGSFLCKTTIHPFTSNCRAELQRALKTFSTAEWLRKRGALLPEKQTGTNVQDLIIARIMTPR